MLILVFADNPDFDKIKFEKSEPIGSLIAIDGIKVHDDVICHISG